MWTRWHPEMVDMTEVHRLERERERARQEARQRREEGSPRVTFRILENGVIENIRVMSSGYRSLDREARRMIMASSPFPPIPKSMKKKFIELTIPININLYSN